MTFSLKHTVWLPLLFLFVTSQSFGQGTAPQINASWNSLKIQLQRRSDIVVNLTKVLSKSPKVDKKQLNNLKAFAVGLFKYVDTLNLKDSISISLTAIKNSKLTQTLSRTLATSENDSKLKSSKEFIDLLMQLEGCENRIALAKREYNNTCKEYRRIDLYFDTEQVKNAPEAKF